MKHVLAAEKRSSMNSFFQKILKPRRFTFSGLLFAGLFLFSGLQPVLASEDPDASYNFNVAPAEEPVKIDEYSRVGAKATYNYTGINGAAAYAEFECTGNNVALKNSYLGGWEIKDYGGYCYNPDDSFNPSAKTPSHIDILAYSKCDDTQVKDAASNPYCVWEADKNGIEQITGDTGDDMFKVLALGDDGADINGFFVYTKIGNISTHGRLSYIDRISGGEFSQKDVMFPSSDSDFVNFVDTHDFLPASPAEVKTYGAGDSVHDADMMYDFHDVNAGASTTTLYVEAAENHGNKKLRIHKESGAGKLVLAPKDANGNRIETVYAEASESYNISSDYEVHLIASGNEDVEVITPNAHIDAGRIYHIRKADYSSGVLNVKLIDSNNDLQNTISLTDAHDTVRIESDGEKWVQKESLLGALPIQDDKVMVVSNGMQWVNLPVAVEAACYPLEVDICPNVPPVAVTDAYTVCEVDASRSDQCPANDMAGGASIYKDTGSDNGGLIFKLPVLDNDYDPNGDPMSITRIFGVQKLPRNHKVWVHDSGKFLLYQAGQDGNSNNELVKFQYEISDPYDAKDTTHVTVQLKDYNSPLVLDLDGDGVEIVAKKDSNAYFDMDMDGIAERTAWIGADDGWLVLDRNQDGIINDRSELFGNVDGFSHGFEHLASLDSDQNGFIDMGDDMFGNLQIWQDKNGDGFSDGNELTSLMHWDIASIDLDAEFVNEVINGQWESHRSTYTFADGTEGQISDIWFEST